MTAKNHESNGGGNGVSRRRLLQAAAAAGAMLPLGSALGADGAWAGQAPPRNRFPPFTVPSPVFTQAERNRRWAAIRANMGKPQWNLDAIITPGADGLGNYARYLTQIVIQKYSQASPEVLFPRDAAKPVIAHISGTRHVEEWTRRLKPNGWLTDGKMVLRAESGSAALAKLLAAEGYDRPGTRIGVAKLKGSRFDPEGLVSYTWFERLKAALPGVLFLPIDQFPPVAGNDTGPIEDASMSKGSEEQDAIRKAVAINERGILASIAAARDGAPLQADLWWACYETMYRGGGEDAVRCSIGFDAGGNASLGEPTDYPVRLGQICNQEISSSFQGYGSQINHAFFIGRKSAPGFEYYRTAVELLAKSIEQAIAFIQPGKTTYGDFMANNEKFFKDHGEKGSGLNTHGGGIGFLSRPRQSAEDNIVVMQPGHAFDYKPGVTLDRAKTKDVGEKNRPVQVGESILVTEKGAVRLGTRPIVPIATHG
ncbi:MAG: M24 family metallopeptidase [Acidobacteriota bacterium]